MPGFTLPEHPYEKYYRRRMKGQAAIFIVTICCMALAIIIFYLTEAGSISIDIRSLGLLIVFIIWILLTGLISKIYFGRFSIGFGGQHDSDSYAEEDK